MRILKHLISIAAIATSTLLGDQFVYVPIHIYEDAERALTPGTVVVHYCSLANGSQPHVVEIVSLDEPNPEDFRDGKSPIRATVKSLHKPGEKGGGKIRMSLDLAYTYYPDHKGNYLRMSDLYNLKAAGEKLLTLNKKVEKKFQKQLDATAKLEGLFRKGIVRNPGKK